MTAYGLKMSSALLKVNSWITAGKHCEIHICSILYMAKALANQPVFEDPVTPARYPWSGPKMEEKPKAGHT